MTHHSYKLGGADRAPEPYRYTECGLDEVFLLNGFDREVIDGEEYLSIHDLDELHAAIGVFLIRNRKKLGPKELRFLRTEMGLSQKELAEAINATEQQVGRWERESCGMAGPADRLVRLLYAMSVMTEEERAAFTKNMIAAMDEEFSARQPRESQDVTFQNTAEGWRDLRLA